MAEIALIVPTRGRVDNAIQLRQSVQQTDPDGLVDLILAVDEDDPSLVDYGTSALGVRIGPALGCMNAVLNYHAKGLAAQYPILGFCGDDHRPRTPGWASRIVDAIDTDLGGTGLAYGNDLLQGENLPTAIFMSSDIVKGVGFMAPPDQKHLYLDDYWRELGRGAGCIRYLPDVIIEHMHPAAGKAAFDDNYARVNASSVDIHDRDAFHAFRDDGRLQKAIQIVKNLRN